MGGHKQWTIKKLSSDLMMFLGICLECQVSAEGNKISDENDIRHSCMFHSVDLPNSRKLYKRE